MAEVEAAAHVGPQGGHASCRGPHQTVPGVSYVVIVAASWHFCPSSTYVSQALPSKSFAVYVVNDAEPMTMVLEQ